MTQESGNTCIVVVRCIAARIKQTNEFVPGPNQSQDRGYPRTTPSSHQKPSPRSYRKRSNGRNACALSGHNQYRRVEVIVVSSDRGVAGEAVRAGEHGFFSARLGLLRIHLRYPPSIHQYERAAVQRRRHRISDRPDF